MTRDHDSTASAGANTTSTRTIAVHPRVILAFTAFAALIAAALPAGSSMETLRFWWDSDPATALASVACLLSLPPLVVASWARDGRGAGVLGAALVMLAAILLGIADRSRCGSLLVAAGAIALIGSVSIAASPRVHGRDESAAARDGCKTARDGDASAPNATDSPRPLAALSNWATRWNVGAGLVLLVIAVIQLARQGATGPAALPPTPPIPTVAALLLGAALFIAGMLGRGEHDTTDRRSGPRTDASSRHRTNASSRRRADADARLRRAVLVAISIALLLAVLVPIVALVQGDRAAALAGARASMLAVAASASLGALLAPDLRFALLAPDLRGALLAHDARGTPGSRGLRDAHGARSQRSLPDHAPEMPHGNR